MSRRYVPPSFVPLTVDLKPQVHALVLENSYFDFQADCIAGAGQSEGYMDLKQLTGDFGADCQVSPFRKLWTNYLSNANDVVQDPPDNEDPKGNHS